MLKHNIFTLFKEFSLLELKNLENFLNSPYYNKSRRVKILFKEIKKYHPEYNSKKLTKEKLSSKINPHLKHNDSTFRDLMSDLLKCVEEFLIQEELNSNNALKQILLLKSYTEKKQIVLFEKVFRRAKTENETKGKDSIYYYNKSLLEMNRLNFNIINKHQKSAETIHSNNRIRNSYIGSILIYFTTELVNTFLKITINDSKFNFHKKIIYLLI